MVCPAAVEVDGLQSANNEIGHLTDKPTIAGFAENAEIIQMLTSLGVDYAQGYGVAQFQRVLKSAVA